ncbi:MAG: hypothetical protein GVY06_10400 [Alphaproteobacteria bacterium]|jgi:hypothetical protein|nr:hypothetical protein [Alphaproteobacteria bacterium]
MSQLQADIVRLTRSEVDIKITKGERMHVLQWRRTLFWDAVLLDGKRQAHSAGLWGREKVYGLVFGRDREGRGGERVMFVVDPRDLGWSGLQEQVAGVRLEAADGPILAYGTLDPKNLEKPSTFSDWMKKQMGMEW